MTLVVAVPITLQVPPVKGRTAADAAAVLQAAGLKVSGTQGSPANPVTGTNPAEGTTVKRTLAGHHHHQLNPDSLPSFRCRRGR